MGSWVPGTPLFAQNAGFCFFLEKFPGEVPRKPPLKGTGGPAHAPDINCWFAVVSVDRSTLKGKLRQKIKFHQL